MPDVAESSSDESGKDSGDGDFKDPLSSSTSLSNAGKTLTPTNHGDLSTGPPSYKEKLEAYNYKYSYMKSWPGLLRLIGGLELILGGMVFACTAAYIQKDYQWSQLYGNNLWTSSSITGGGFGYNYYGPMTPFVLVVASLVWLVTVILLGLGVTMYYRTILLNSHWWPLSEFALNLIMFLLYMAAAIAYINDVNRGGLCYSIFVNNPLIVALCRVEGGQVAAITFLFITTLLYLVGSFVCLKMWRHEAARKTVMAVSLSQQKPILLQVEPKQLPSQDEAHPLEKITKRVEFSEMGEDPKTLNSTIPMGHNPKPYIVPDYVIKYPAIRSVDDREKYKAVFQDQYAEYKELYRDVHITVQKFKELEALLSKLPPRYWTKKDQDRASTIRQEYKSKKEDPTFLEKQERCDYLKRKLTHIKSQIQAYDCETNKNSAFF
ncbi:occludin/ELL domain-containing protein 1 [Tiliqua scincoides]|uniref:occludin/ELL domain-containing protein 1 n=1 Tax=Tiliqua scincoides TaxID=71010 RepID=UPI0034621A31